MFEVVLTIVLPILGTFIGVLIPAFIVWFAAKYHQVTGLELSAEHRAALHSALETGIGAALNRGLTGRAATAFAVSYAVQKGAPDAVKYFTKGQEQLADFQEVAERKLQEATSGVKLSVDSKVNKLADALNKSVGAG